MRTKEDFDKEWGTCKHCGITKEGITIKKAASTSYYYNYVMNGQCKICKDKKDREYDFKEASRDGSITREESIMCPYCGDVVEDDLSELHGDTKFTCYECDKESDLSVEYSASYTTTKIRRLD